MLNDLFDDLCFVLSKEVRSDLYRLKTKMLLVASFLELGRRVDKHDVSRFAFKLFGQVFFDALNKVFKCIIDACRRFL